MDYSPLILLLAAVGFSVAGFSAYLWLAAVKREKASTALFAEKLQRYSLISDIEAEAEKLKASVKKHAEEFEIEKSNTADELQKLQKSHQEAIQRANEDLEISKSRNADEIEKLKSSYREKKAIYDRLVSEIAIFDDRLAFSEMGVYEPHFEFSDSEAYKAEILKNRAKQKDMISNKYAVTCSTNWSVDGSAAKGAAMTNRNIRLTLRAFNGECDAAVANTRWNNVNAMEKRIVRAKEQIENLNKSNAITISSSYLKLKLEELYLTHEHREKIKSEREERAEALRLARDEQKLLRDMENAQEEEAHYAKLLEKAKAEAASIIGPQLDAFSAQIKMLERDLAKAHEKAERAKAMAEQTRSGYVYIISNIGSFGEGIVKIGLTRRLDPMDRIRELGDASVPFTFDIHAMIYSDDAPGLERALHGEFESTRINVQNYRKEFFRAALDDVEIAVQKLAPSALFFKDVEAQEYRETMSRRAAALTAEVAATQAVFPSEL